MAPVSGSDADQDLEDFQSFRRFIKIARGENPGEFMKMLNLDNGDVVEVPDVYPEVDWSEVIPWDGYPRDAYYVPPEETSDWWNRLELGEDA